MEIKGMIGIRKTSISRTEYKQTKNFEDVVDLIVKLI